MRRILTIIIIVSFAVNSAVQGFALSSVEGHALRPMASALNKFYDVLPGNGVSDRVREILESEAIGSENTYKRENLLWELADLILAIYNKDQLMLIKGILLQKARAYQCIGAKIDAMFLDTLLSALIEERSDFYERFLKKLVSSFKVISPSQIPKAMGDPSLDQLKREFGVILNAPFNSMNQLMSVAPVSNYTYAERYIYAFPAYFAPAYDRTRSFVLTGKYTHKNQKGNNGRTVLYEYTGFGSVLQGLPSRDDIKRSRRTLKSLGLIRSFIEHDPTKQVIIFAIAKSHASSISHLLPHEFFLHTHPGSNIKSSALDRVYDIDKSAWQENFLYKLKVRLSKRDVFQGNGGSKDSTLFLPKSPSAEAEAEIKTSSAGRPVEQLDHFVENAFQEHASFLMRILHVDTQKRIARSIADNIIDTEDKKQQELLISELRERAESIIMLESEMRNDLDNIFLITYEHVRKYLLRRGLLKGMAGLAGYAPFGSPGKVVEAGISLFVPQAVGLSDMRRPLSKALWEMGLYGRAIAHEAYSRGQHEFFKRLYSGDSESTEVITNSLDAMEVRDSITNRHGYPHGILRSNGYTIRFRDNEGFYGLGMSAQEFGGDIGHWAETSQVKKVFAVTPGEERSKYLNIVPLQYRDLAEALRQAGRVSEAAKWTEKAKEVQGWLKNVTPPDSRYGERADMASKHPKEAVLRQKLYNDLISVLTKRLNAQKQAEVAMNQAA